MNVFITSLKDIFIASMLVRDLKSFKTKRQNIIKKWSSDKLNNIILANRGVSVHW